VSKESIWKCGQFELEEICQVGSQELQYPYEFDEDREIPSLVELLEFLKSPAKANSEKDVKTPF
jgi:hypothetical protein